VKPSLREILADSHVAAVSIAVLFLWSLASGLQVVWDPFWGAANFVFTSVGIPYIPRTSIGGDRLTLIVTATRLAYSFIYLAVAWFLSRWVYGLGPLRSLTKCLTRVARRNNV
jgi:hypothetical protein